MVTFQITLSAAVTYHWWRCRRPGLSEVTLSPSGCPHTHLDYPSDPPDLLQRSYTHKQYKTVKLQNIQIIYIKNIRSKETFELVSVCVCIDMLVCACVLEGQSLATEVCGCAGIEDGATRLGGVVAQSDVSSAAQDVALSAWTPLWMNRQKHTNTHTHTHTHTHTKSSLT